MTRSIRAHKGGRTARAPAARMTPQERGRLDAVLEKRAVRYIDWLVDHVEADYEQFSGGNEMADKEYEYRYYEDGELYDKTAPGEWMTPDEAKKRNRDLEKSPDSIAVSRKWIRTSK